VKDATCVSLSAVSSGPALLNEFHLVAGGRALGTPKEAGTVQAQPAVPPVARRTVRGKVSSLGWVHCSDIITVVPRGTSEDPASADKPEPSSEIVVA
jgi:hypothetical protein